MREIAQNQNQIYQHQKELEEILKKKIAELSAENTEIDNSLVPAETGNDKSNDK